MVLKTDIETQKDTERKAVIDPLTRLGPVHLTVADLDRQVRFHQEVLGFQLHWQNDDKAGLGAGGEDLFHFTERKGARRVQGTTGLYHTAILVPTKLALAQLLARIAETRTPIQGMTDHRTHLAIYLADAEGNGLELAWDFPREQWPVVDGQLSFQSRALDPRDLVNELARDPQPWIGMPPLTQVGHVHLQVADFEATRRFYHEILGFDLIVASKAYRALFVSAGGYHHHIGLNLWNGEGAPPPPADARGLQHFTVYQPTQQALDALRQRVEAEQIAIEPQKDGFLVRDPAQNAILFQLDAEQGRGRT